MLLSQENVFAALKRGAPDVEPIYEYLFRGDYFKSNWNIQPYYLMGKPKQMLPLS